jgi:hypothetical protein
MFYRMRLFTDNYMLESREPPNQTFIQTRFYANEGVYTIDDNNIYKLNVVDGPLIRKRINGYDLIIDPSYTKKEQVYQLPFDAVKQTISVSKWTKYDMVNENGQVHFESEKGFNQFISLLNKC